jgi:hypothetical protein
MVSGNAEAVVAEAVAAEQQLPQLLAAEALQRLQVVAQPRRLRPVEQAALLRLAEARPRRVVELRQAAPRRQQDAELVAVAAADCR